MLNCYARMVGGWVALHFEETRSLFHFCLFPILGAFCTRPVSGTRCFAAAARQGDGACHTPIILPAWATIALEQPAAALPRRPPRRSVAKGPMLPLGAAQSRAYRRPEQLRRMFRPAHSCAPFSCTRPYRWWDLVRLVCCRSSVIDGRLRPLSVDCCWNTLFLHKLLQADTDCSTSASRIYTNDMFCV